MAGGDTPVCTAALTAQDESSVIFRLSFTAGANGTAHESPANDVVANFPAFQNVASELAGILSWEAGSTPHNEKGGRIIHSDFAR